MLRRLLPDRLSHWLVALVIGGILVTQALALSLYHADRMRALEIAQSRQAAECVAGFARILRSESPDHRRMMMRPLMHRFDGKPEGAPNNSGDPPQFTGQPEGPPPDWAPPGSSPRDNSST